MLNKLHAPEVHVAVLADALKELPVDTIFIRPAARRALEEAWDRQTSLEIEMEDGE